MYSWEIRKILNENNYQVGGDDLIEIINIDKNPQLRYIKYSPYDNSYYMKDDTGEEFIFHPEPYEVAEERGLIKVKKQSKKI